MAQRMIHFDYFTLSAGGDKPIDIGKDLSTPKIFKPIQRENGSYIWHYTKFELRNRLILGTLINNQMNDIPASFDNLTQTFNPLVLSKTQGLAHPTSFLFDRDMNVLMYESSNVGVSLGSFCQFIEHNFSMPNIETSIVIDLEEMKKYMKLGVISKIEIKIAKVKNGSLFNDKNTAVSKIITTADKTNATSLTYIVSAGKSQSLDRQTVHKYVSDLKNYISGGKEGPKEVKKLIVTGREDDGGDKINIDFIKNKLRSSIGFEKHRQIGGAVINEKLKLMEEEYLRISPTIRQMFD